MNQEKAIPDSLGGSFSDKDAFSYISSLCASLSKEEAKRYEEIGRKAYEKAKRDYQNSGDYELFVKNAILDGMLRTPSEASKRKAKSSREDPSLTAYYGEVSKFRMLTPQEEKLLGAQLKLGRKENASLEEVRDAKIAKETLVSANLRLVVSIAKDYSRAGVPLLDLIQEGNTGLIKAADRFDVDLGTRFSTYATPWIKQAVMKAVVEQGGAVQIPLGVARKSAEIRRIASRLSQKLEREPTNEEIASETSNMDAQDVAEMLSYTQSPKSMNDPLKEDSEEEFIDAYQSSEEGEDLERSLAQEERMSLIAKGLSLLREDEKEVIVNLYGIGCERKNLREVAELLGKSIERIRQIRETALWRMRKGFGKES
jgi:RNA polymerase primary sigma factor